MDTTLRIEQIYDAPIAKVWQALTSAESLRAWYFPQIKKFEAIPGFQFEFTDDGSPYRKIWRVNRVVKGQVLSHSWDYHGYPGNSEVTFMLSDFGHKTLLTLTHTGIDNFPADPHFARRRFEAGWQNILGHNLKDHLQVI